MGKLLAVSEQWSEGVSPAAIQEQLDRILACPAFQNSRRYPRFIKFIVSKAITGSVKEIKERVIGIEVFDRPLNYEPSTDPVVRLVAGEIRKRLAQYYIQPEHQHELRIEIPPGSYVPLFRWSQQPAAEKVVSEAIHSTHENPRLPEPNFSSATRLTVDPVSRLSWLRSRRQKLWFFAVVAILVVLSIAVPAGVFWWTHLRPRRMLNAFWEPLLTNGPSTLICIGDWTNIAPALHDALNRTQEGINYVGPYDLGALARMVGMLGRRDRQFSILLANDVTLTDLRSEPGILIGSSNNRWTPTVLAGTRFQFRFETGTNKTMLVDTQNPKTALWTNPTSSSASSMSVTQDVGLIARIISPATGQIQLVVAGAGRCGTTAASEFITNPEYFKQIADYAPLDWENRNIEMVVSTNVINGRSGPPHLVLFDVR